MRHDAQTTPESPPRCLLLTLLCGRYDAQGRAWPESGAIVAEDWSPYEEATGLVGVLWGEGVPDEAPVEFGRWTVWEAPSSTLVELAHGQFRAPCGTVLYSGGQEGASGYLLSHGAKGRPIVGLVAALEDGEGIVGGDRSRIEAGSDARIRVGHGSRVSAGDRAFVVADGGCRVQVGDGSNVMGGGHGGLFVLGHRCGLDGDVSFVQVQAGRGCGIAVGRGCHVEAGPFSRVTVGARSWFRVGVGSEVAHLESAYSRDCPRTELGTAGEELVAGALYFVTEAGEAILVEGGPGTRVHEIAEATS